MKYSAPHLKVSAGDISERVLVMGDPFRVEKIALLCDSAKEIAWNREYRTFNAFYKGVAITLCSHGVGAPGAAICFEELIKCGAKVIIRLGTGGSLRPDEIKQGDLVVSLAAAREDGCTQLLVAPQFPAISDSEIALALKSVVNQLGARVHCGVTLTHSLFYNSGIASNAHLKLYADSGCLAVEMEVSALFVIASLHRVRAGALFVIDGSPFTWQGGEYHPDEKLLEEGKRVMFLAGLQVITQCATN